MLVRNKLIKTLKFLGKVILILLLVLLCIIFLVHVPTVQKRITRGIAGLVSTKLNARVEIEDIYFSLLGDMSLKNMQAWDPDSNQILSVHKIEITSSLLDLFTGKYLFDKVHIEGVDFHLQQEIEGLNIQFILDAFLTPQKKPTTSKNISLHINKVILKDIQFDFVSGVTKSSVYVDIGNLESKNADYNTKPGKFKADQLLLENTTVKIINEEKSQTDSLSSDRIRSILISPDFGLGVEFEVENLLIRNGGFAFHTGGIKTTPKFDASHIDISSIHLASTGILIRKDTLCLMQQITSQSISCVRDDQNSAAATFRCRRKPEPLWRG